MAAKKPPHHRIYEHLHGAIASGRYRDGQRLPSEAELVKQFDTSRPTVARALRDLQADGLVERKVGSGSYVRFKPAETGSLFGLLIPGLGDTEIFEPISRQMAREAQAHQHTLLWGEVAPGDDRQRQQQAERVCRDFIDRRVRGVFFAPLELTPEMDDTNRRIVQLLEAAAIPFVLLDRDVSTYPRRSRYDVVGIDNHRAGYMAAEHLIRIGRRRIAFAAKPHSAPTVARRIAGYRDALTELGSSDHAPRVVLGDVADARFASELLTAPRPDAIICANDTTAAQVMRGLQAQGVRVPDAIGIVGFDDVNHARLLSPGLTTVRQPCADIGTAALAAMLERIEHPTLAARDIRIDAKLVVRHSCGARLPRT